MPALTSWKGSQAAAFAVEIGLCIQNLKIGNIIAIL